MSHFKNVSGVVISTATMGLGFNSVVTTIAGTRVNLDTGEIDQPFNVNLDPADGKQYGLIIEKASIDFWKTYYSPQEIKKMTVDPLPYLDGLNEFSHWYRGINPKKVWFISSHFHAPILRNACQAVYGKDSDPLWYNNVCDTITLTNVFGDTPELKGKTPEKQVAAHAQYLVDFFESLKG